MTALRPHRRDMNAAIIGEVREYTHVVDFAVGMSRQAVVGSSNAPKRAVSATGSSLGKFSSSGPMKTR